jgi:hypothetical protein
MQNAGKADQGGGYGEEEMAPVVMGREGDRSTLGEKMFSGKAPEYHA